MFANGLEEFDDARYVFYANLLRVANVIILSSRGVVEELLNEYKACESPDYISYVSPATAPSFLVA